MSYCKIGKYYDLIYVLTEFFSTGKKNKWIELNNISDCIRPFFYIGEKGYSFMQNILNDSYEDLLQNENIEVMQNKIIDCENTVNNLVDFYFGQDAVPFSLNDRGAICDINKEIIKSKYPSELKSSLYALFIEPVKAVHELMRTLLDIHWQLDRMYENRTSTLSKVQKGIKEEELLKRLNISDITSENMVYAVCLLDSECVKVIRLIDRNLLLIGEDYHKSLESAGEHDLKAFGYVLTEMNRLKLLNMMRENGEITIKDIEQKLGFSGTNAYYHLSLMIKSGVVTTRYQGRTVFYSIHKPHFKKLGLKLSEYYKE